MREMFRGLAFGLAVAVAVIFLLLTAYFQSVRLALDGRRGRAGRAVRRGPRPAG